MSVKRCFSDIVHQHHFREGPDSEVLITRTWSILPCSADVRLENVPIVPAVKWSLRALVDLPLMKCAESSAGRRASRNNALSWPRQRVLLPLPAPS